MGKKHQIWESRRPSLGMGSKKVWVGEGGRERTMGKSGGMEELWYLHH
jgi:hypothetical protein